jgi:hypothetical protein
VTLEAAQFSGATAPAPGGVQLSVVQFQAASIRFIALPNVALGGAAYRHVSRPAAHGPARRPRS